MLHLGNSNLGLPLPDDLDPERLAKEVGRETLDWLKPRLVKLAKDDVVPALIDNARPKLKQVVGDALDVATDRLHDELPELLATVRREIPGAVTAAIGAVPTGVKVAAGVAVGGLLLGAVFSFASWRAARRCGR